MREINEEELESTLETQIVDASPITQEESIQQPTQSLVGQKLQHNIAGIYNGEQSDEDNKMFEKKRISRFGENLFENAELREGWLDVDKALLGERAIFYPEDWQFKIRPATVEAIRNWSMLNDENALSVNEVFNEILKSCVSIRTSRGPLPWGNIRSWDRFFFVLLVREYTFINGETKIEWNEECPNCDNPVTFKLTSTALTYQTPDPEVMRYFSQEDQTWMIDPAEFEVNGEPIVLHLPTLDKDANITSWIVSRVQDKKKVDNVFIKFLPWMAKTISKDATIAARQIREYEATYREWDTDMFSLMNDIINNISVNADTKLIATCPTCGEEVTSDIRFPNGISALFNVSSGRKKFGKK